MKSPNLARRIEPDTEPAESPPAPAVMPAVLIDEVERPRARPRFERRTIEIRDQGFAPFRVR